MSNFSESLLDRTRRDFEQREMPVRGTSIQQRECSYSGGYHSAVVMTAWTVRDFWKQIRVLTIGGKRVWQEGEVETSKYLTVNGQEFLTHTIHLLGISVIIGCENSQLETRISKYTDCYRLLYNRQLQMLLIFKNWGFLSGEGAFRIFFLPKARA